MLTSVFKWLNSVTEGLFVSANRPLFVVVNTLSNDDFANGLCHLLAVDGADVVTLMSNDKLNKCDYLCYDGVFHLKQFGKSVIVTFYKSSKIIRRKFPENTFSNVGNIYNL